MHSHWGLNVGIYLSSQAAARQVFSAQVSLTSVFGMGTGGPSPQSTPTIGAWCKARTYDNAVNSRGLYHWANQASVRTFRYSILNSIYCLMTYYSKNGDPYEIRTRVAGVRGRSLRPLDQRATIYNTRFRVINNGAPSGIRTRDTLIKSQVLYQLS